MRIVMIAGGLLVLSACSGQVANLGGNSGGGGGASFSGTPMSIATGIQEIPFKIVSDGTTLYWLPGTNVTLTSMPVGGGAIAAITPVQGGGGLLAVDNVNVYFGDTAGIHRVPKDGGAPSILDGTGANIGPSTTLGSNAYWVEIGAPATHYTVQTTSLLGGPLTTLGEIGAEGLTGGFGVTTSTIFLGGLGGLGSAPIGLDAGVPTLLAGGLNCSPVSDTDAVYCYESGSSVTRVASDGTETVLGAAVSETEIGSGGPLAFDDTYVYWVDDAIVGTIMRVPKTGGTATVIAHDTSPIALAVDANAVYWSNAGGQIMRLAR